MINGTRPTISIVIAAKNEAATIAAGDADHVSASRLRGGSSELHGGFDEFFRLAGSTLITACINRRCGVRLSDSQNGFRAIRTSLFRDLDLRENHTTIGLARRPAVRDLPGSRTAVLVE